MKALLMFVSVMMIGFQSQALDDSKEGPCREDIKKFCADVKPGQGAIMRCLRSNQEKLSAACKEKGQHARAKMREHMKDVKDACAEDFKKFCGETKPGHGRKKECMRAHRDHFSAACKAQLDSGPMKQFKKNKNGSDQ